MERIIIPSTVKAIGDCAFKSCKQLVEVGLQEGLESIGVQTFRNCTLLQHIQVPSSVTLIHWTAFDDCPQLSISYSNEIEVLVSQMSRHSWWDSSFSSKMVY